MGLVIVFLDGVGLGDDDATRNPLVAAPMPFVRSLLGGAALTRAAPFVPLSGLVTLQPVDATLGIDGLPQSGTGQATLWSGVNVAARLGRHDGPYAPAIARDLLLTHNLFLAAQEGRGRDAVAFANA